MPAKPKARKPRLPTLDWREEFDDWDNSIWIAPSPFHDDAGVFEWRLEQELRNNRIEWIDASCHELNGGDIATWLTLEEAKLAISEAHQNILRECANV